MFRVYLNGLALFGMKVSYVGDVESTTAAARLGRPSLLPEVGQDYRIIGDPRKSMFAIIFNFNVKSHDTLTVEAFGVDGRLGYKWVFRMQEAMPGGQPIIFENKYPVFMAQPPIVIEFTCPQCPGRMMPVQDSNGSRCDRCGYIDIC